MSEEPPPKDQSVASETTAPQSTSTSADNVGSANEAAREFFTIDEERKFKIYSEQRKTYSDAARDAYDRYHQGILAAAGGIVLLSFASLKDIGHATESLNWLLASWIAVVVTGVSALIALITSATAARERITQIDCLASTGDCDESRAERYDRATVWSNVLASVACVLSVVFFGFYLLINVQQLGGEQWQQKKQPSQQRKLQRKPLSTPPLAQPRPTPANVSTTS